MTTITDPVDLARVRIAAEDYAAHYHTGPFRYGLEDTCRYLSEGNLDRLCDKYGLPAVWDAVREVLQQRPELMTASTRRQQQIQNIRATNCDAAEARARAAFKAGDKPKALAAICDGELADPDHRVGRRSWQILREIVNTKLG